MSLVCSRKAKLESTPGDQITLYQLELVAGLVIINVDAVHIEALHEGRT
jgi:hypothetical protein